MTATLSDSANTSSVELKPLIVAFASDDGQQIDGHFGSCQQFYIYQVTADGTELLEARTLNGDGETREDKNLARARGLADCQLLVCKSIGGPAAAKVIRVGVHPMKVRKPTTIAEHLDALQEVMQRGKLPPWLAKTLGYDTQLGVRFAVDGRE